MIGQVRNFFPQRIAFIVVFINRHINALGIQGQVVRDKIPGKSNGALFAVIPKGPVAQHFKPCQVAAVFADLVQIIVFSPHAHAGLHGKGAGIAAGFKP